LEPPEVAERVAQAGDAVAPGLDVGQGGHDRRAGVDGALQDGLGVFDVQAQHRRCVHCERRVEEHHDRGPDADFGVADLAGFQFDAAELFAVEGVLDELDDAGGIARDDPRRDRAVALGDRCGSGTHGGSLSLWERVPVQYIRTE
jgi:hypothetical protein